MYRVLPSLVLLSSLAACVGGRRSRGRLYYDDLTLRLQGGTQPYAGRVQVFHKRLRTWGGICHNGWTKTNADVVCRQLGYRRARLYTKGVFFGRQTSTRRIWLDNIKCNGREHNLGHCRRTPFGYFRCSTYRLAGVMCEPGKTAVKRPPLAESTKNLTTKLFEIRLVSEQNGGIVSEGHLLVQYGKKAPGYVCSDGWSMENARVACGELGFSHAVTKTTVTTIRKPNLGFGLKNVKCTGNEATLLSCSSSGIGDHKCESGVPVSLKCETRVPQPLDVRLRGGTRPSEGRIEVRRHGSWATLCDKDLDISTANTICRSRGFGTARAYTMGTVFPHGTTIKYSGRRHGNLVYKDAIYESIQCTGNEMSLESCSWKYPSRKYPCKHYNDAGVRCNVPRSVSKTFEVGLITTRVVYRGIVKVKIGKTWGVICGDRWTMKNAMVVCRQLGLGYAQYKFSSAFYGRVGPMVMSGITCFGNETSLDQCLRHSLNNITCFRRNSAAAVSCSNKLPDLAWDVEELRKSLSLEHVPLTLLQCAQEENCLASSATPIFQSRNLFRKWRSLIRFSAKVHNVGTSAYKPSLPKSAWEWHACHRHYHSDEEFALYDMIDANHRKVAEGHKASYCLEDTKCDEGVDQFFNCENRGDQGISVNCHDNYISSLDCQWIDVTDLSAGRNLRRRRRPCAPYKIRVVANPSYKVAESDYTNNVVLCDISYSPDESSCFRSEKKCYLETCSSGVRSHRGNGNFACCRFPFIYKGKVHHTCLEDKKGQFWCATTENFDTDAIYGYC